jgi:hypothetical protein
MLPGVDGAGAIWREVAAASARRQLVGEHHLQALRTRRERLIRSTSVIRPLRSTCGRAEGPDRRGEVRVAVCRGPAGIERIARDHVIEQGRPRRSLPSAPPVWPMTSRDRSPASSLCSHGHRRRSVHDARDVRFGRAPRRHDPCRRLRHASRHAPGRLVRQVPSRWLRASTAFGGRQQSTEDSYVTRGIC